VTVTDAGPLVALVDLAEPAHAGCVEALNAITPPLVTTWPALTEAMHLLRRKAGWPGQESLWRMVRGRNLDVRDLDAAQVNRTYELMLRYHDLPMALADATLVAVAESLRTSRVFTLDGHFRIYRTASGGAFEVTP
jgi:predicted nucleic acid-binding protein